MLLLIKSILISAMVLGSSLVISSKNPVDSVLFLVLIFLTAAAFLVLEESYFLALIFVIIYVGAIAVLFLFIVMMLNIKKNDQIASILFYVPFFVFYGVCFLAEVFISLEDFFSNLTYNIPWLLLIDSYSDIVYIGLALFQDYYLCVLLCGVLLLVAMVGSIVLAVDKKVKHSEITSRQLGRSRRSSVLIITDYNNKQETICFPR